VVAAGRAAGRGAGSVRRWRRVERAGRWTRRRGRDEARTGLVDVAELVDAAEDEDTRARYECAARKSAWTRQVAVRNERRPDGGPREMTRPGLVDAPGGSYRGACSVQRKLTACGAARAAALARARTLRLHAPCLH